MLAGDDRGSSPDGQLGFDDLLAAAEENNRKRRFDRETAHLPGTMDEAVPWFRMLIEDHHAAMLKADVEEAMRLREEADLLALKLNDGEPGILAHDDAPGRALERETAASTGDVPLWGQTGAFIVAVNGMQVRVELDGVFGTASNFLFWPGFATHAVDPGKPFISETGYRSFIGIHAEPAQGLTPQTYVTKVIEAYITRDLKGKLKTIDPRYR